MSIRSSSNLCASISLLIAVAVAAPRPASAQVPAENQAPLILRILAFDRKVAARASTGVRIALVYRAGNAESEQAHKAIEAALGTAAKKNTVAGQAITLVSLPYTSSFEADLQKHSPVAAYICPGLEDAVATLSRAAQASGALTFTANEPYVRSGLAVGLVRRQAKIGILINLKASREEGAELDSGLLQIAEVIR